MSIRDIEGDRWLQTVTGKPFFLFNPRPGDFDLEVIAHALSMQCRFNGHTKEFYSVAEHSVMVALILGQWGCSHEVQATGLLHDAAEAYIGDCIRPLKQRLRGLKDIENRIEEALSTQFELPWPWPEGVKRADNYALTIERRDLLSPPPRPWRGLPEIEPGEPLTVHCWRPGMARRRFLDHARVLGLAPRSEMDS